MLEIESNTIKVLGIFGRLSKKQEVFFDKLEATYSSKPETTDYEIFRHLTLTFVPDATVIDLRTQLSLLKDIKKFLPLKVNCKKPFMKSEESYPGKEHIALELTTEMTKEVTDFLATKVHEKYVVKTPYIKILWFVPNDLQNDAMSALSEVKELVFDDFYLVSNKQDEANTIFTSSQF